MTDAERIAAYIGATVNDVENAYLDRTLPPIGRFPGESCRRVAEMLGILADVRREEREACALIADAERVKVWTDDDIDALDGLDRIGHYTAACGDIAAKIRARGEK